MSDVVPPRVVLASFPASLFDAAAEQWDGMLREYALRGLGGALQAYDNDEVTRAGNALAAVEVAAARAGDVQRPTLALDVPAPADFALLQGILDDALALADAGELLVFPSLPELVALRNWLCEQVTEQAAGAAPVPWTFRAVQAERQRPAVGWDATAVDLADGAAWIVGDEHNRIVDASPAALSLLGWTDGDLVGQRLLAVIPPDLRERHVAGFTRSVVSGGGSVLGRPMAVPALHRDGTEVPILLTLSRHAAGRGAAVYLARLDPPPAA